MKKSFLFIFVSFVLTCTQAETQNRLTLYFFGSSTCGECAEIKEMLLKPLLEKYPEKLSISFCDFDNDTGFQLAVKLEKEYKVTESFPQELFFPDTVLLGYESIMETGEELIEEYLANPDKWIQRDATVDTSKFREALEKRIEKFTFWGIFAAGMVDGVNPCAIATMIFLISFLATQKRKRFEVLIIGLSFTLAVFCTYLLLGLGAFRILTALKQYYWVSEVIRWAAVICAGIIALYSFYDAFAYGKTGKTEAIKLQLPKPLKMRIHKVISGNLTGTQLVTGAIVTGFLVTLLEAVCTGQVYLPTIVLMTKSTGFQLKGWLYLVFYNFLFVLPLLLVMVLAYFGLKWNELAKMTQKHLTLLKILLGIVMMGLAVFLAVAG